MNGEQNGLLIKMAGDVGALTGKIDSVMEMQAEHGAKIGTVVDTVKVHDEFIKKWDGRSKRLMNWLIGLVATAAAGSMSQLTTCTRIGHLSERVEISTDASIIAAEKSDVTAEISRVTAERVSDVGDKVDSVDTKVETVSRDVARVDHKVEKNVLPNVRAVRAKVAPRASKAEVKPQPTRPPIIKKPKRRWWEF